MPDDSGNNVRSPGDFVREELRARGWTQHDLAQIIGRPQPRVNELVQGKLAVSPEIAIALATAFGGAPEEWLRREAVYRLALTSMEVTDVRRRAGLYMLAPIKDIQRRGWVKETDDPAELEREILSFFRIKSLDEEPSIHGAMRKTAPNSSASPAQRAWAFRVRQVAEAIPVSSLQPFDEAKLPALKSDLRKLAAYSTEVKKAPALLARYGIRYVVVEGLPGAKMDGFATRLDDGSPVVGMSLKHDRLDSFWHTLAHEIIHIQYHDEGSIDGDAFGDDISLDVKPPIERRADDEGAAVYVPPDELESFIRRAGPTFPLQQINQFANRIKMHPNVIIGQLKGKGKLGWSRYAKGIPPIRSAVIRSAVTDGWGKTFYPGAI